MAEQRILDVNGLALDRYCQSCTGRGFVVPPELVEWWDQLDELRPKVARGEVGAREWKRLNDQRPDVPDEMGCGECTGIGFVPTPQGAAILALMRRYRPWA